MAQSVARGAPTVGLPAWISPQLTQLVDSAPEGHEWLHEIKYDGYRMHARLDRGAVKLLTRTGLDWTHKYPPIAKSVTEFDVRQAYLDGELYGVGPDGITSFNIVQLASDSGNAAALVFFLFDLLYLDGDNLRPRPLIERKERLKTLLANAAPCLLTATMSSGGARLFTRKPAGCMSRASSRNASIRPMRPATAACGARSNACTARNSSWSAGPIPKDGGPTSARCCSPTTIRTDA
jgi:bifunctional non-homologous end joining protein LigD